MSSGPTRVPPAPPRSPTRLVIDSWLRRFYPPPGATSVPLMTPMQASTDG
jgi:hypothetical protein